MRFIYMGVFRKNSLTHPLHLKAFAQKFAGQFLEKADFGIFNKKNAKTYIFA